MFTRPLALSAALLVLSAIPALLAAQTISLESDQLPANFRASVRHMPGLVGPVSAGGAIGRDASGGVLGIDSVVNFQGSFYDPGLAISAFGVGVQFTWPFSMVGRQPFGGQDVSEHTTRVNAPIVPVIVDLRNADGSPRFVNGQRLISDPTKFVTPVLNSPIFQNYPYSSSERPTQFNDAVHRAQFFHKSDDDWHTILTPSVKSKQTMVLIRGTYLFALNPDGTCCAFIIADEATFNSKFFPPGFGPDTTSPIGAAESAGDIKTSDISSFLFPDTYLANIVGTTVTGCCVAGFHTYDLEPGDASNGFRERRYVLNYSAYTSTSFFTAPFLDITALSHELSETFSDPFVSNATPIWLAPNGNCQNNLESGDVIEGLPNMDFPITINNMTYHPQNEALLQWFAGQTPSSAIKHAYSYPDTTVLTTAATSLQTDCATPFALASAPR
jgi:hypothetical protein